MSDYAERWAEGVKDARVIMATEAHHKLGDISRDEPDYIWVRSEDEENYYGEWISGFGFIEVRFPKSGTREMTDEERQFLIDHPAVIV